jgi:hypothetical protein
MPAFYQTTEQTLVRFFPRAELQGQFPVILTIALHSLFRPLPLAPKYPRINCIPITAEPSDALAVRFPPKIVRLAICEWPPEVSLSGDRTVHKSKGIAESVLGGREPRVRHASGRKASRSSRLHSIAAPVTRTGPNRRPQIAVISQMKSASKRAPHGNAPARWNGHQL